MNEETIRSKQLLSYRSPQSHRLIQGMNDTWVLLLVLSLQVCVCDDLNHTASDVPLSLSPEASFNAISPEAALLRYLCIHQNMRSCASAAKASQPSAFLGLTPRQSNPADLLGCRKLVRGLK